MTEDLETQGAVDPFGSYRFHRIRTLPRRPDDPGEEDRTPAQLTAAVTAAHAVLGLQGPSAAMATAWVRPGPGKPLHILVGGRPFFPPSTDTGRSVLYPPGATADPADPREVAELLDRFPHWLRCTGFHDALRLGSDDRVLPAGRRGSFDDAVAHLPNAFAWLVIAEPLPAERLEQERTALSLQIPRLRQRENSAMDRLSLERAESRHRELTLALGTGLWNVHVLVAGQDTNSAHAAAALLCGAGDLDELPYLLAPTRRTAPLHQTLALPVLSAEIPGSSPFVAPADLVAALARPPARELPGIRTITPSTFDVTAEDTEDEGFTLGRILDESLHPSDELRISRPTLNRHAFVCGATGSGKSQTVRSLLTALATHEHPIPWLAIEPAKAEYARMAGRLGDKGSVTVIRPGAVDVAPASLNPLEPEPGFPLQSHVDLVRALFLAAFEGHEPFPQVLARALTQCYTAAGWDLVTGDPRPAHKPKFRLTEPDEPRTAPYPTLGDLQKTAQQVVETIGYGKEVTADVRGFVDVRIGSLREGTPGRFFEGGHPLDIAGLLEGNVVLELESITNDQDKAFLIGTVLIRLVEHLRVHHGNGSSPLRHIVVVEEAHRLLKNVEDGPAAAAVELFASLLAEIRAYGEGVVIVEQIPSKILPDVIKNSALKVMHRLPAADDRQAVGATMNLQSEQSEYVVALPPGRAAVTADGMDRPVLLAVPHDEHRESSAEAKTAPPLLGSRSPLCSAGCHASPCTLRAMNDATYQSSDPLLVLWTEAVASTQAMGMAAPDPAPVLRERLTALPVRERECVLAYAAERATSAREPHMRAEVDPGDFADRLITQLAHALGYGPPPTGDPRRFAYGNYRWRDVLLSLHRARRQGPGHTIDRAEVADWATRGLVLTATTPTARVNEIQELPQYADDRVAARVGDVRVSGMRDAVLALTGGVTETQVTRAFQLACTGEPLAPALSRLVGRFVEECADE
ncbi:ATP-binding protein [Streptomyces sp. NPDC048269]|uniref:ATP-binding protein n=1 Tax=Streptomyces sp. NPDC048269 TaxID=3155753 RepID=UPI0034489EF3